MILLIHSLLFLLPLRISLQIRAFNAETQHKADERYASE
jgi:hypothetical protein